VSHSLEQPDFVGLQQLVRAIFLAVPGTEERGDMKQTPNQRVKKEAKCKEKV